jgi:hypothetical protein
MLARRQIVMGAAAAVGSAMIRPLAAAPFEWRKISPSDAGFASDLEARLDKLIADKRAWGLPELDLVIVVTAGNYSEPEQWLPPIRVVREVVLPNLH